GGGGDKDNSALRGPGETASASGNNSVAIGSGAQAYDNAGLAVGAGSVAGNSDASLTAGRNSVAVGTWFDADGDGVFDAGLDRLNIASAPHSSALGGGHT